MRTPTLLNNTKRLVEFFKNSPFKLNTDLTTDFSGLSFKMDLGNGAYKEISISDVSHTVYLSFRDPFIHCGPKTMDRVMFQHNLSLKEGYYLSSKEEQEKSAYEELQRLFKVLPLTEEYFDKILNEYKHRILGETTYEEVLNLVK